MEYDKKKKTEVYTYENMVASGLTEEIAYIIKKECKLSLKDAIKIFLGNVTIKQKS